MNNRDMGFSTGSSDSDFNRFPHGVRSKPRRSNKLMGIFLLILAVIAVVSLVTLAVLKIISSADSDAECSNVVDSFGPKDLIIHDVVGRGRARLFKLKDGETDEGFEEFFFNPEGALDPLCLNVPPSFENGSRISSTFGTCVRTYSEADCVGVSVAHYPRITSSGTNLLMNQANDDEDVTDEDSTIRVRSIGNCFTNELDDSIYRLSPISGEKEFEKRKLVHTTISGVLSVLSDQTLSVAVPDVLEIAPKLTAHLQDDESEPKSPGWLSESKTWKNVTTGQLMFVKAYFRKLDLTPEDNSNGEAKQGQQLKPDLVAKRSLVFHASSWNRRAVTEMEDKIEKYLQCNPSKKVVLRIQFLYETSSGASLTSDENGSEPGSRPKSTAHHNNHLKPKVVGYIYRIKFGREKIQSYYFTSD